MEVMLIGHYPPRFMKEQNALLAEHLTVQLKSGIQKMA